MRSTRGGKGGASIRTKALGPFLFDLEQAVDDFLDVELVQVVGDEEEALVNSVGATAKVKGRQV